MTLTSWIMYGCTQKVKKDYCTSNSHTHEWLSSGESRMQNPHGHSGRSTLSWVVRLSLQDGRQNTSPPSAQFMSSCSISSFLPTSSMPFGSTAERIHLKAGSQTSSLYMKFMLWQKKSLMSFSQAAVWPTCDIQSLQDGMFHLKTSVSSIVTACTSTSWNMPSNMVM